MEKPEKFRTRIRQLFLADEAEVLKSLTGEAGLKNKTCSAIQHQAVKLIKTIRQSGKPGLMEEFLAEYGLSTDEGVALMCLAEALLRVPDSRTINELIEDKIAPSSWGEHLGGSSSSLVNASTWALMLTGKILKEREGKGIAEILHGAVKRLGEPLIRIAVKQATVEMGHQFVLGRTIGEAISRGRPQERSGFTYSYDMLGEAALTAGDADGFYKSYKDAIRFLQAHAKQEHIRDNPEISIKLSALHPRYEMAKKARVMDELVPRVMKLALMAKEARMGLNIDAEEADRLDLSLDVIEAVLSSPELAGWHGFGVAVQAYGKAASAIIDWLYALAVTLDRKIMVRLVKGAYWDTEIKRAQVSGVRDFPVFTAKAATDVSYICCARKLLDRSERIYPQFATHNAHSVTAILEMAPDKQAFEFQRLHGMGEALHEQVKNSRNTRCRIYAPVGSHRDLLSYLVRRLLENGANSSFVNQMTDSSVSADDIAADPFLKIAGPGVTKREKILRPADIFGPERKNSRGWDLANVNDLSAIDNARTPFAKTQWQVQPLIASSTGGTKPRPAYNPADPRDLVGLVAEANADQLEAALAGGRDWSHCPGHQRAAILRKASELFEDNCGEFFAALSREAGKTPLDAVAELREAVDFLRYYANDAERLPATSRPCGLFACISPWNFPLAIFTGQIAAALAAGNGVLAKPAESTPITASIAIRVLHEAGVPRQVLQFLPGTGALAGAKLTSDNRVSGVCFTGSTTTARMINQAMAGGLSPTSPIIAETGGINAMIVDSTALLEQAVSDVVTSAFQSAGQRCSALRILYVQEDIAAPFLKMLQGAMDELSLANPWEFDTDIGPLISASARSDIEAYIAGHRQNERLIKQLDSPPTGHFLGPALIRVDGLEDLEREIFGPVLHIASFRADEIDHIIRAINNSGFGLTFGLHSRIDDRVEQITSRLNVGNLYVNRNQIGAIVGSQPFGGEGLSGTGPKAGGPHYVERFVADDPPLKQVISAPLVSRPRVQALLDAMPQPSRVPLKTTILPGPTGESNRLSLHPRGTILCLGPTAEDAHMQAAAAMGMGCPALQVAPGVSGEYALPGFLEREALRDLEGLGGVAVWSDEADLQSVRKALGARNGPLLPLIATPDIASLCVLERHVCIDTTAAGGNVSLLAAQA